MKPESPSEPFKRAVTVAVRFAGGEPELEVNFLQRAAVAEGSEGAPALAQHRNLSAHDIALCARHRAMPMPCAAPITTRRSTIKLRPAIA